MRHLVVFVLLVFVHGSAVAQLGPAAIDGIITFNERQDTVHSKLHRTGNESFLIRSDPQYYYIGIHSGILAAANVILNKGDEFIVIHSSGCTGRGIYKRVEGDSLAVIQGIYNVMEHSDKWDVVGGFASQVALRKEKSWTQQQEEMKVCLSRFGYMGSTLDRGSYRDAEILLDRKVFSGYRVLLQNTELTTIDNAVRGKRTYYPAGGITGQGSRNSSIAHPGVA